MVYELSVTCEHYIHSRNSARGADVHPLMPSAPLRVKYTSDQLRIAEKKVKVAVNAKNLVVAQSLRDNNALYGGGEGWANGGGGDDKDGKESDGRIHYLSPSQGSGAEFVLELNERDWLEIEGWISLDIAQAWVGNSSV